MATRRIFISCGQETDEELRLGKDIKALVERDGMEGFLAQTVHSADELNRAVFGAIQNCGGFCAVLHRRGEISYGKYAPTQRSSVWIQQEIALLMYRRFLEDRTIPIRVFSQKGILLEGVMKYSIANPIEFEKKGEVLEGVSTWLKGSEFEIDPIIASREKLFQRRIKALNDEDWSLLDLIVVHSTGPGDMPSSSIILNDFSAFQENQGRSQKEINDSFQQCHKRLRQLGLVHVERIAGGTIAALGVEKQWWDLIPREIRSRASQLQI